MLCRNPIIPGFAPDPSIVRIEDTFYLVNSSFHLFPGLPIFASKDLISWRHVGNAISRPTQLRLSQSGTKLNAPTSGKFGDKPPATGGLYAPTIRHHNGVTYIACTNVIYNSEKDLGDWVSGLDFQNFIISTPDICIGQWTDPIYFDFHGIDPDIFFDDDDRAYISGSCWEPSPSCCISCFEIEVSTGHKLTQDKVLWNGFTNFIPEGPHIYKRNGYYYLLIAEGGTHEGHCISIARAPSIWGPYESCSENPILPPAEAKDPSSFCYHNGHGDLVQDLNGDWWLACLGVRKDRAGRIVLGRETFLTAVYWPDKQIWPRIQHPIPQVLHRVLIDQDDASEGVAFSSALPCGDSTPSASSPKMDLVFIRDPDSSRCRVSEDARTISLLPLPTDLGQYTGQATSFIGRRVRRLQGDTMVDLIVSPTLERIEDAKLGLAYFKDEYRYARIMYEPGQQVIIFHMVNNSKCPPILMESSVKVNIPRITRIQFRIAHTEKLIHFLYRTNKLDYWNEWHSRGLVDTFDMTGNDFTGPLIGVFAIGNGEEWCTFENLDV